MYVPVLVQVLTQFGNSFGWKPVMQEHREADRDPAKQTTTKLCTVCMSCPRSVKFQCGHCIACHACAGKLKVCPYCRQKILVIFSVPEDNLGDSDLSFSDPGHDDEQCFLCSHKAIWVFTCPDCASKRVSSIIDSQSGWEKIPHSRFVLCKRCLGVFRCPVCKHLAVKTDVLPMSDDD